MSIEIVAEERPKSPLSIAICAFNGLEYTKLLIESLRKHSKYEHELLIYSDGSKDGTLAWLRKQKDIRWQHDHQNRGICTAMNRVAKMSTRDYLFFPNTDHVVAPGWDQALLSRVGPRTVVSSKCIEPGIVPVASIFHAKNCGTRWDDFAEGRFHAAAREVSIAREVPGVNYPFALSKALWDELGGLDETFNPGPANDPDLFYRLTFAGARMVRGDDVVIYHFSGKSSRMADEAMEEHDEWHRLTVRNEARFLEKWGERYQYVNGGLPQPGTEARRRWRAMNGGRRQAEVLSRLRIVVDARTVGPRMDGISLYTRNLIRALARLPEAPQLHALTCDQVQLEKALGAHNNILITSSKASPGDLRQEREQLPEDIRSAKADLFHGPAFAIPPGVSVPAVVTVHDLAFMLHPEWYPPHFVKHLSHVLRESMVSAAGVITNSDITKKDVLARFPDAIGKVHRIYEALPEELKPGHSPQGTAEARSQFTGDAEYILSVGVQQRRKNAAGLVRAFARIRHLVSTPVKLVLVGGRECEDPSLPDLIQSLNLESEVILTPHLPNYVLIPLYRKCRLFVYPSLYEGFGFPPLEAMAHGVPVVCSNRGSLSEVVGRAARLVDPEDTESFSQAMADILTDSSLRDDLIRRGTVRVADFSWEKAATETLEVYKRCLDRGQTAPAKPNQREQIGTPPQLKCPQAAIRRSSRLRVAIDARLYGSRRLGTGRYTHEILKGLFAKDRGAEFVLIGPKNADVDLQEAPIIQLVPAGMETLLDPAWEQFTLPTHLLGCDVYFSPTGIVPVARPCRALAVVHDLGFLDHPDHFDPDLQEHLCRWVRNTCLSAERLVAVSKFTEDRIARHFQIERSRMSVVHHGRSTSLGATSKATSRLQNSPSSPVEEYILCVSSFELNKNHASLISGFKEVSKHWPGNLVLAGRKGRAFESLRMQVSKEGLEKRVRIVAEPGDREILDLYRQATLFVYPSMYEGFGLPLLEAMGHHLPTITSRMTACPEVAGEGAFLIDEPTPALLGGAIKRVLEDRSLKEQLSRAAGLRAEGFSWSRAADETWQAIEECVEVG